ncbi:MAG: type 1 glutamine amidotransferase [Gammaproteobacteria bacterium]|nr:type 1 glutamine amidotransferase [Gammaproteobacteria bacterium]MDE0366655.1 type 1 glutamine amidotransferase [Gammaproteobacteria bacterium]
MRVIVFQHADSEHPGVLRGFMEDDGHAWEVAHLDRGDAIPALERFDGMLVMGGPQDVWQRTEHPWLADECAAIRRFVVDLRRPFLGVCLGHQLLAEALGGRVERGVAEVGVMAVEHTEAARTDRMFRNLDNPLPVLQWHGAEVAAVPPGGVVLASSPACAIQAFRFGENAYGMQFHVEITGETVADWMRIPEYGESLERVLGTDGGVRLDAEVRANLSRFERAARTVYECWIARGCRSRRPI